MNVVNGTGKVKVDKFGKYCKEAMTFRKQKWKWSYIPNAVHETYGHITDNFKKYGGHATGHRNEVHYFIKFSFLIKAVLPTLLVTKNLKTLGFSNVCSSKVGNTDILNNSLSGFSEYLLD